MCRAGLVSLFLALLPPVLSADTLVPKSGKAQTGVVVSEGAEVVFNPYWSKNPAMTWGVVRLPADRVKKVEVEPRAEPEVRRRLKARAAGDTAELASIARYAESRKLKAVAELCWALLLAEEPTHVEALAAIGGAAKFESLKKGNPLLDPALLDAMRRYASEPDPAARAAVGVGLKTAGLEWKPHELERLRRSARQPKGYEPQRPVALRSDVHVGATYALFVPEAYDPAVPWPLLIGLHGGGPDGKSLDEVVGSGPSAMNFYRDIAAQRGFIVACPTALVAGWSDTRNEALVRDVILEVKALYHIDIDRVYMTGHSMGGYGTWALGPKMAADLAAISPMAGQGGGGISALVEHRCAIFIYHSDDDFIDVSTDRNAAKQLAGTDHDFVYTEIPGQGHGFPESVRHELFDFCEVRRRQDKTYKEAWPRSSFLGRVTKEEATYLGDPEDDLKGKVPDLDALVGWLRLGGGRAADAVARLSETKPVGAADAVSKVFRDPKASGDARAYAARLLGVLGDPLETPSLRKAVAAPATREGSRMAVEAAKALVLLADPEGGDALEKGIEAWTKYYEDKVMGSSVRISDWERTLFTLAPVVEAWGALAAKGDPTFLKKTVVARVLAPQHKVEISDRVPQDPSEARTALAKSIASAFRKRSASPSDWDALLAALSSDSRAQAAASASRTE